MSDKNLMQQDYDWNEEEKVVESSGNTRFAKARLYVLPVNRFVGGEHFTLPGVFQDDYDEGTQTSSRVGPKEFRGMTLSDKHTKWTFYPLVLETQNSKQQWFQRIIGFGNWKDKDDTGCAWLEFQKGELLSLPDKDKNALMNAARDSFKNPDAWTYIRYTEGETGYTGQYEIKKYLTDIAVYSDEAQWQKESVEFFAQFSNGDTAVGNDHYPATWKTDIQGMIDHIKQLKEQGQSDLEIAKAALLLDADSGPVVSIKGDNVDAAAVLGEILNVPAPTIKL
jgi:hypothetical protein